MILSVHHYDLTTAADAADFRAAVDEAIDRGLFDAIPGLVDYRFGRGIKGARTDGFAAVWTYESREAWADVWGPVEDPVGPDDYPAAWRVWEDDLLAPILSADPDAIEYTTYEVVAGGRNG